MTDEWLWRECKHQAWVSFWSLAYLLQSMCCVSVTGLTRAAIAWLWEEGSVWNSVVSHSSWKSHSLLHGRKARAFFFFFLVSLRVTAFNHIHSKLRSTEPQTLHLRWFSPAVKWMCFKTATPRPDSTVQGEYLRPNLVEMWWRLRGKCRLYGTEKIPLLMRTASKSVLSLKPRHPLLGTPQWRREEITEDRRERE